MKKRIAVFLIYCMLCQCLLPTLAIAGEGPAAPEAARFEPVDTSDLVNLFTGNFTYNMPLFSIPGPEGDWPLNIAYHAGIGPNSEASWVGLGWSLNPGAINRFVSGYPDDYWAGKVKSHYHSDKQSGYGVNVGLSYGPAGMALNYDSYTGQMGVNASLQLTELIGLSQTAGGFGLGGYRIAAASFYNLSLQAGTSGIGLSTSLGLSAFNTYSSLGIGAGVDIHSRQKPRLKLSASSSYRRSVFNSQQEYRGSNSLSLLGVSFSSQNQGGSFSIAGSGARSQSVAKGSGLYSRTSKSFPIPLGLLAGVPGLNMNLSYYEWEWFMNETDQEKAYGSLHQLGYEGASLEDIWEVSGAQVISPDAAAPYAAGLSGFNTSQPGSNFEEIPGAARMERTVRDEKLYTAEDIYQVNAWGLTGTFQPRFHFGFEINDGENTTGQYASINGYENTGDRITFRFLGDPGGNFIPSLGNMSSFGDEFQTIENNRGSKQILPVIHPQSGLLLGFRIYAEDGRIYEFFQPVLSFYQFSKSFKDGSNGAPDVTSQHIMSSPYATSWLLTAVKGPDYIDRGTTGFSADDWGYWVHFRYSENGTFVPWRSPYQYGTYAPSPLNDDQEDYSEGLKEKYYLSSIETATHIAFFNSAENERLDNQPARIDAANLGAASWEAEDDQYSIVTFPFDKSRLAGLDISNVTISGYYHEYYTPCNLGCGEDIPEPVSGNCCQEICSDFVKDVHLNLAAVDDPLPNDRQFSVRVKLPNRKSVVCYNSGGENTYAGGVMNQVILKLDNLAGSSFPAYAKKLDNIKLHKKALDENWRTDYTASRNNPVIEGMAFNYDYSLQPGALNSQAPLQGKLTLRSLSKKGLDFQTVLPATKFFYDAQNPAWRQESWDYWNGYSASATATDHFNSESREIADRDAAAWLLNEIISPLGASTIIEYESDIINYIADKPICAFNPMNEDNLAELINPEMTTDEIILTNAEMDQLQAFLANGVDRFTLLLTQQTNSGTYHSIVKDDIEILDIDGNTITLNQSVAFQPDYPPFNVNTYALWSDVLFGGGHRVKSITLTDGNATLKTRFKYRGGVTPVLPSAYESRYVGNNIPVTGLENVDALLLYKGSNTLGPAPVVGYEEVEVMEVAMENGVEAILKGKTRHRFYTAKSAPSIYEDDGNVIRIKDRSSLFGRPRAITIFGQHAGSNGGQVDDFYPVRYDSLIYRAGSNLLTVERALIHRGNFLSEDYPLGFSQQKYISNNWREGTGSYNHRKIDHQRENFFLTGNSTRQYFYHGDGSANGVQMTEMNNLAWDALNGQIIVSEQFNSLNAAKISEEIPAYWHYPEMASRNMLSQSAGSKSYLVEEAEGSFLNLKAENDHHQFLLAAEAITWKDWGEDIWRQNDVFQAIDVGANFTDFDYENWAFEDEDAQPANGDFPAASGWKRTANITQYDRYSHPLEERRSDGSYSATIYGYEESLPVVIAVNARASEIVYDNFEDGNSSDFRTGNAAQTVNGYLNWGDTPEDTPVDGNKYTVTVWVRPLEGETLMIACDDQTSASVSEPIWQLLRLIGLDNDQPLSFSGEGLIDDLRIYPDGGQLTTFSYHPELWKVTSITDANDNTTFYEYDAAGRLSLVRNQDRDILQNNTYRFGNDIY